MGAPAALDGHAQQHKVPALRCATLPSHTTPWETFLYLARSPAPAPHRWRIMRQCAQWLEAAQALDSLFQRRLRDAVVELHGLLAAL